MNTDIRLHIEFWEHAKTKRMIRVLGLEGPVSLQRLWCYAAKNRPDGTLADMDAIDIEAAAGWPLERAGEFFDYATQNRWLDRDEGDEWWRIHEWVEYNPWAANVSDRREKARYGSHLTNHVRRNDLRPGVCHHCRILLDADAADQEDATSAAIAPDSTATSAAIAPEMDRSSGAPSPSPSPSPSPAPIAKRKTETPTARAKAQVEELVVDPDMEAWAYEVAPGIDLDAATEAWRDHFRSNGYRTRAGPVKNGVACWRTWIRNEAKFQRERNGNRNQSRSRTDRRGAPEEAGGRARAGGSDTSGETDWNEIFERKRRAAGGE